MLERRFIACYDSTDPQKGYNVMVGGTSSGTLRPEEAAVSKGMPIEQALPLYNCYGEFIGKICVQHALQMHGVFLQVRARGTGRRRHFTSAKLYARKTWRWEPRVSDGFVVMQLVRE